MIELTERRSLRGGHPCWPDADEDACRSDALPATCEIAIVGAGIMGAMLAERLARDGRNVALLDRRPPAQGSTAASTALVMWAADVPLSQLVAERGADKAEAAWRRVHRAVLGLEKTVGADALAVQWRSQPELYLAGGLLDEAGLQTEAEARKAAGLPSIYLEAADVAARFELPPRAALLSEDSFAVDPIALTLTMLKRARAAGATISFPADVTGLEPAPDGIVLTVSEGRTIHARQVILATGYEVAPWYLPAAFQLGSSYAIATAPGIMPGWGKQVLIWEASSPYLYARATTDGRIIVGGEDENLVDATARDRLLPEKRGILEAKGAAMLGLDRLSADCAWAATFGSSPDGLPAVGRARNADNLWLAAGFGGNGVSFAALAAELLAGDMAGAPDPDAYLFDPYRFG